jgi:hypothetical protein
METGLDDCIHGLARLRERDRDVEKKLARSRVGDDGSLVADDEIVEPSLFEVRPHRAEHPARDDDDVGAGGVRPRESLSGPWPQHAVLGDERPVEVECEGGDGRRKRGRELYGAVPPVESTT